MLAHGYHSSAGVSELQEVCMGPPGKTRRKKCPPGRVGYPGKPKQPKITTVEKRPASPQNMLIQQIRVLQNFWMDR